MLVAELGNTEGVPGRLGSGGLWCEVKWGFWRTRRGRDCRRNRGLENDEAREELQEEPQAEMRSALGS